MPIPDWLNVLAWLSILAALACAIVVAVDVVRRPQHMAVMNLVWPLTALYAGPLGLLFYWRLGRPMSHHAMHARMEANGGEMKKPDRPFWQTVAIGVTHCGSGCTLADVLVESVAAIVPGVLVLGGLGWLWHDKPFAAWTIDYVVALLIGLAFQYFAIVPMRKLSPGDGIVAAFKADVLSLTAWQVGMYGWMAIALFAIFGTDHLDASVPAFWLMMQIAMLAGFATAFPVNWWLIRSGIKEKM